MPDYEATMRNSPNNPFADYGTIIAGDRFIGREPDLCVIRNRLLGTGGFGSLAIVGMPRVGKSSLVRQALFEQQDQLRSRHIVAFQMSLGEYSSAEHLFADFVTICSERIASSGWSSDLMTQLASKAAGAAPPERFPSIRRFLRAANDAGVRVIAVLDEFDSARYLFGGQRQYLHWLRELASNPEYKIGLVLVSKRELSQIGSKSTGQDSSYWHNVFMDHHLSVFSADDMETFYRRLHDQGVAIDAQLRQQIAHYCGNHPFYLDVFAFHLVDNLVRYGHARIESVIASVCTPLLQEYSNLTGLLAEDQQLSRLLQVLFGPVVDVTPADINLFLRSGILTTGPDGSYTAFSPYFSSYLRVIDREVDLWPLWRDTEKRLRSLLNRVLIENYGDDWPSALGRSKPKLQDLIGEFRTQQRKEKERFGERASGSLLDYAYPLDLFTMISAEWSSFHEILGKDRSYWNQRFTLLSKIRTPLAHNRDLALLEHERDTAEGYCKELIHLLSKKSS